MLKHEYDAMIQAERDKLEARSWLFTLIMGLLAVVPVIGIIAAWQHFTHDGTLFFTIILPLAGMAIVLGLIALVGRPRALAELMRIFPIPWFY